jgi:hypothetical protein
LLAPQLAIQQLGRTMFQIVSVSGDFPSGDRSISFGNSNETMVALGNEPDATDSVGRGLGLDCRANRTVKPAGDYADSILLTITFAP